MNKPKTTSKHKYKYRPLVLALQAALATGVNLQSNPIWAAQTTRVSVNTAGTQGNYSSGGSSISADGRFIAFGSIANNLMAGDVNLSGNIYVRDRLTNQTTRVGADSSNGSYGPCGSSSPVISGDGRFVAFDSTLGICDNASYDVFVSDRITNFTTVVTVDNTGFPSYYTHSHVNDISSDGRFVAFESDATDLVANDTNGVDDLFIYDLFSGKNTLISVSSTGVQGNDFSGGADFSPDGRFVAFTSYATNLIAGDTNLKRDIFVRDRLTKQTTRVSMSSTGVQANNQSFSPSISANGRFVMFSSDASNLVSGDTNGTTDVGSG